MDRKVALEVAYSTNCYFEEPSNKVAYPEGQELTQTGLDYAMPIIAQLKNIGDTPNPIMQNILSFLPSMNRNRPAEAILLVAPRNKPQEKISTEQCLDIQEDNPLKRVQPSHKLPSKRQRISAREIASLEMNANETQKKQRFRMRNK